MLKITLNEKNQIRNVLVPESRTIRQVLVDNHVDYSSSIIYLNALPILPKGLDTKFSHMSDEATHYVISIEPIDSSDNVEDPTGLFQTAHGPKAYLFSSVCIIVSSFTPQEKSDLKHSKPELLQIEDEAHDPVFALDVEDGYGSIKEYGAVYSDHVTCEGKATITILLNAKEKDLVGLLQERLSEPLQKLVQLEKKILSETHGIPITSDQTDYQIYQI